ncbi:type 2C protein phosphatase PTC2 NDAI_0A01750 [Naumovozyma dairenensis CBS 421]|uniref:protein-serine/threonine phosphatase n=1 Tax=Naumovozyma dairenensis (strain ATCC 10597 / BCRC 20456 / CBS 421 / NBRC 0211 / NRRL Y-12639) TaxID=1071378 RepID=G0W3E5_NAUDC|nr:hypothetical protein NDAI_0A01750 [Naumovozyma dairenensis CBS 421]CCD22333.1 hypothetical protein NDAI_0A01750 [Naumovozyma dairenensis CBS 421]
MGQILSNPVIDKEHHSGTDLLTAFGLCAMQGWRMSMEDSHIVEPNVLQEGDKDHIAFYSVFDGHGGSGVAEYCGEKVTSILQQQQSFKDRDLTRALIDTYLKTDEALLNDPILKNDHSGCTATSILISKLQNVLICGNSGDSRTVLSTNGVAKTLSYDHKPTLTSEKSRITAADGFVEMDRVNGNLALSRAIGDFEFKNNKQLGPHEQIVTCVPDIIKHNLNYEKDEFVILACDGIWDCLTSQECVDLIHYGINKGDMSLNDISSRLIDVCCSPTTEGTGIGCDNMSIVIVALLNDGESVNDWFERVRAKKHNTPISFELKRKVIYNYYEFPTDESAIFDITTKKPQERFTQDSNNNAHRHNYHDEDDMEIDETDADADGDNEGSNDKPKRATDRNGPIDLLSLEALLGAGIQVQSGPDNISYIAGNALSEVLNSLSKAHKETESSTNESSHEVTEKEDDSEGEKITELEDSS